MTKEARIYNGAKTASSINGAGKLDSYMFNNEIRTLPSTIHKDKFKMDLRCKCKTETIKLLAKSIEHLMTNHSKIHCDPPPRVMEIRRNVNKWDLIKHKSICTAKETLSKVKGKP